MNSWMSGGIRLSSRSRGASFDFVGCSIRRRRILNHHPTSLCEIAFPDRGLSSPPLRFSHSNSKSEPDINFYESRVQEARGKDKKAVSRGKGRSSYRRRRDRRPANQIPNISGKSIRMSPDEYGRIFRNEASQPDDQLSLSLSRTFPEEDESNVKPRTQSTSGFWFPPSRLDISATCLPGLESILSEELREHGIRSKPSGAGKVELVNPRLEDIFECHLHLGTASRILMRCGEPFTARGLAELRRKVAKLPWRRILKRNINLQARVRKSHKSKLYHSTAIRDRVVFGIYEALGYSVPDDGTSITDWQSDKVEDMEVFPVVRLDVSIAFDQVSIFIDTSTTPVHQRGYRLATGKAPLREDIAFGMLWMSGWRPENSLSKFSGFLDPFCGSGTIPIEAASMAIGLPPGRLREPPLQGTKFQNPSKWERLVQSFAIPNPTKKMLQNLRIRASDRNAGAIEAAQSNARRAGVHRLIKFDEKSLSGNSWFEDQMPAPSNLLIATNPPFGKRVSPAKSSPENGDGSKISSRDRLLPLVQTIGEKVKNLTKNGCSVTTMILSNDQRLMRRTSLENINVAFQTKHGGLDVHALMAESTSATSLSQSSSDEEAL